LNLYDFYNTAVSQGKAATSVKYGGLYNRVVQKSQLHTAFLHNPNFILPLTKHISAKFPNFIMICHYLEVAQAI